MKPKDGKTVRFQVRFRDLDLARAFLEECSRDPAIAVNILRGRITESEAWFRLEATGDARRVDDLLLEAARSTDSAGLASAGVA